MHLNNLNAPVLNVLIYNTDTLSLQVIWLHCAKKDILSAFSRWILKLISKVRLLSTFTIILYIWLFLWNQTQKIWSNKIFVSCLRNKYTFSYLDGCWKEGLNIHIPSYQYFILIVVKYVYVLQLKSILISATALQLPVLDFYLLFWNNRIDNLE